MLRLNVGIEAHTHEYIVTAHIDSKFGMLYDSDVCQQAIARIQQSEFLRLEGFHAHIGSQIFDMTAWLAEIDQLVTYLEDFQQPLSLNLGGALVSVIPKRTHLYQLQNQSNIWLHTQSRS